MICLPWEAIVVRVAFGVQDRALPVEVYGLFFCCFVFNLL